MKGVLEGLGFRGAVLEEAAGGLEAGGAAEREFLGDEVAESVGGVGAGAVGFIDFGGGLAGGVEGPDDLFEVAEEFVAFGVDEEAGFAGVAAEAAVDAVDAVADGGVYGGRADGEIVAGLVVGEEFADESPVGGGSGGAALVATGIAIDVQGEWEVVGGDETVEGVQALDDGFAGAEGIGIGLENDFVEDIHRLANALQ